MRIQIMSDLHLEFKPENYPLISSESDALVFAGDISSKEEDFASFVDNYVRDFTDAPVIFVLGNHDYYGKLFSKANQLVKDMVSSLDNVHVLDNECVIIDDVKFVGTTLWTDFDNRTCEAAAMMSMPDYSEIKKLGRHFELVNIDTSDVYARYEKNVTFLEDVLDSREKSVVVTHHLPSFVLLDPFYEGSFLNGAFYANLDELIWEKSPNAWICGHTHKGFSTKISKTMVYCNPYGYPFEDIYKNYIEEFIVEV